MRTIFIHTTTVYKSVCMWNKCRTPWQPEETDPPEQELWPAVDCLTWSWETNPEPLEEQQVLLPSGPSPHPQLID